MPNANTIILKIPNFVYDPNKSSLTTSNDPNKFQSIAHIFLNY